MKFQTIKTLATLAPRADQDLAASQGVASNIRKLAKEVLQLLGEAIEVQDWSSWVRMFEKICVSL